jgi:arsenate reductase (glutaredoxin)
MKLYGIANCNTVKKARDWLAENGIEYEFHDFKKLGVNRPLLENWLSQIEDSKLINRAGMTWRNLDESTKESINSKEAAIKLMYDKTSVIKRPILEKDGQVVALGFSESQYQALLK